MDKSTVTSIVTELLASGIVIGGRVHYGHSYSAGEFRSTFCTPQCRGQFSLSEEEAFRIEEDPRCCPASSASFPRTSPCWSTPSI